MKIKESRVAPFAVGASAIVILLTTILALCGVSYPGYYSFIPGLGLALLCGGLALAWWPEERPYSRDDLVPIGLACLAVIFLGIAVWRVIPSSTDASVTKTPAQIAAAQPFEYRPHYAAPIVFTVGKGDGLIPYVGYWRAITLAEQYDLAIYKDKGHHKVRITADKARMLQSKTDRVQVTVMVCPGDRFNLDTGVALICGKTRIARF